MAGEGDAFILLILACIFPPAAVAFVAGCGADLCLNILLTILGYLPGCLHAFWLVLKRSEANERYGYKNWTYSGMGEYAPSRQGPPSAQQSAQSGQSQVAPPPGPAPQAQYAPQPSQAPVDQKGQYESVPPPPPPPPPPAPSGYGGYQADQKGGYTSQQPPGDQPYGYQAPQQQAPIDQKQGESTAQSSSAPPGGT